MLPQPGYIDNGKTMYCFTYENDSERWLGKTILCKFKSYVERENGFAMDAAEYNTVRNEILKMQKKIMKKYLGKAEKSNTSDKQKIGDKRDLLFLN